MAKHFDEKSKEYIGNGHYRVGGIDFMSIWTFKKKYGLEPNTTDVNGSEGQDLNRLGFNMHSSTPDFGGFSTIYIYPVEQLKKYYAI